MGVKIIHDGITLEVSEQAAEVIAELNKRITEALAEKEAAEAETEDAQTKLAAKDAEIEALKDAQLTDAQLDEAVAARAELIGKAKKIVDQEYKGSEAEIKKSALVALLGDSMQDKEAAYIDARFDIELERITSKQTDHQHDDSATKGDADERYRKRLQDAWRKK